MTITDIVNTIIGLLNWFSWFVGVTSVVMGLYCGYLFMTAGDDSAKAVLARKTLLYTIIGVAVSILSFGLIAITKSFF